MPQYGMPPHGNMAPPPQANFGGGDGDMGYFMDNPFGSVPSQDATMDPRSMPQHMGSSQMEGTGDMGDMEGMQGMQMDDKAAENQAMKAQQQKELNEMRMAEQKQAAEEQAMDMKQKQEEQAEMRRQAQQESQMAGMFQQSQAAQSQQKQYQDNVQMQKLQAKQTSENQQWEAMDQQRKKEEEAYMQARDAQEMQAYQQGGDNFQGQPMGPGMAQMQGGMPNQGYGGGMPPNGQMQGPGGYGGGDEW
jgi:hypothetical protein